MARTAKKKPKPKRAAASATPPPPEEPRHDGRWAASVKLVCFIRELSRHGNVSKALTAAHAARSWIYWRRETDVEFADAFERARRCGLEVLKDEAHRRAYEGVLEPLTYQGEVFDHVRKYSDVLLMFLIKQADPTYRDRVNVDIANEAGRPFMFQMQLHPDAVAAAKAAP